MTIRLTAFSTILLLAACTEVIDERRSSVTVMGETYPIVTQTLRSGDRTYDVSRVRVENVNRQCDIERTNDCEATVKEVLSRPRS